MSEAAQIRSDEGYCEIPYRDTLGYWSVGTGINIDSMPVPSYYSTIGQLLDFITDPNTHAKWFEKRLAEAERGAKVFAGEAWETLSEARRGVLINCCYQLGYPKLSGFKRFREAVQKGQWVRAEAEMLDSKVAREQTPERWRRLASRMLEG